MPPAPSKKKKLSKLEKTPAQAVETDEDDIEEPTGPTMSEEEQRAQMEAAKAWLAALTPQDVLSKDIFDEACIEEIRQKFSSNKPFPYYVIPNFVDETFLSRMYDEITHLDYKEKNNDLYLFSQSERDLKDVRLELITKFREVLYSDSVKNAISKISGIELYGLDNFSQPDIFSAVYSDTSRLLCHDDELEGRRIAYILYLVPEDWCEADGGHLDLFASDPVRRVPTQECVSLVPRRAAFAFFEVSEASFHQVREVLSASKLRVSVGGWFHGPPITRSPQQPEAAAQCLPPVSASSPARMDLTEEECLEATTTCLKNVTPDSFNAAIEKWVSRDYRKPATIKQIVKRFGNDSSIELKSFLRADKYEALVQALVSKELAAFKDTSSNSPAVIVSPSSDSDFAFQGPINLRCYYRGKDSLFESKTNGEDIVAEFGAFLRSPEFFRLITLLTTCDFKGSSTELRLFRPGCYTLAHDLDLENAMEGLDVLFCVMDPTKAKKWTPENGGSTHYLKAGEDEELLTTFPSPNTLSLIFRSPEGASQLEDEEGQVISVDPTGGILTFTRYVDHHAPCSMFQYRTVFRMVDEDEEAAEAERIAAEAAAKAAAATKKKKSAKKYAL